MIRRLVFISIMAASMGHCFGQAGFKIATGLTRTGADHIPETSTSLMLNYQLGMAVHTNMGGPSVKWEFLWSRKGRKNRYDFDEDGFELTGTVTDNIHYFDIPILFTYPITDKLVFEFGPYAAFNVTGNRKSNLTYSYTSSANGYLTYEFDEKQRYWDKEAFPNFNNELSSFEEEKLNRRPVKFFDFGVAYGISYMAGNTAIGFRISRGLRDVFNNSYANFNANSAWEGLQVCEISFTFFGD